MGSSKSAHSPAAHLLLCGPVSNRPTTVPACGLGVGDPCFREIRNPVTNIFELNNPGSFSSCLNQSLDLINEFDARAKKIIQSIFIL